MPRSLDNLREDEFPYIRESVYLDNTGAAQTPVSIYDQHHDLLRREMLGNPHSQSPASRRSTHLIEEAKAAVLDFLGADDEYELVWTPNASGSMRVIGESYTFDPNTGLFLAEDDHNSVLGLREDAKRDGAEVGYWGLEGDELRLGSGLGRLLEGSSKKKKLLVAPAQSNFSGVIHPLSFIDTAHDAGAEVVLDAAAFAPTHPLNLSDKKPEAACLSFYKILGYPTGLGALVIRKDFLAKLRKKYFAGGTVKMVSRDDHVLKTGPEAFENGTINFKDIPALKFVLDFIRDLGGIKVVEGHVRELTAQILSGLLDIKGVRIYGPKTMEDRGGTIAFNIDDPHGSGGPLDHNEVIGAAAEDDISIRGGCFCNPIPGIEALQLSDAYIQDMIQRARTRPQASLNPPGALRVSPGLCNTPEDVKRFIAFVAKQAGQA